jgi:hypothetical protein
MLTEDLVQLVPDYVVGYSVCIAGIHNNHLKHSSHCGVFQRGMCNWLESVSLTEIGIMVEARIGRKRGTTT